MSLFSLHPPFLKKGPGREPVVQWEDWFSDFFPRHLPLPDNKLKREELKLKSLFLY